MPAPLSIQPQQEQKHLEGKQSCISHILMLLELFFVNTPMDPETPPSLDSTQGIPEFSLSTPNYLCQTYPPSSLKTCSSHLKNRMIERTNQRHQVILHRKML
uniref:Lysine-specific demethylase JMJ706-like isoform X1 n=1 Tax=Rhizophora mucronata TaxID=61149 RepID=A0A2P2JZL5_RHIMU